MFISPTQFSSVQSCPTLCNPMNCSTPGLPVHHQLPEFTQTHRRSAFFTVQLSHPYMTTGKTIALTRRTLVGKVMSLLLNMLSRLVMTFLPRSNHLLISWLQSPSAVILEPPKIKSDTVSTVSPSTSHEVMRPDAMIFVFWMLSLSQLFHSPLLLSSRGSAVPLHFWRSAKAQIWKTYYIMPW